MIRRISEEFVPAAINLYRVRKASDGARELFQSVQRQKDQYQGVWIVSPDGKVLSGRQDYRDFKNGAVELLETMDAGLQAFGPVGPRRAKPTNPLPHRGIGVQAEGSVTLALYGRQILGGGRETIPAGVEASRAWLWDGALRADGPTMIDSLTLSPEEWSAFSPAKLEAGASWSLPEGVARKLVRLLTASSDQSGMPRPEDATVSELKASVESIEGGLSKIRLAGRWEMSRLVEGDPKRPMSAAATAEGEAVSEGGKLRSLLMVFDSTIRHGRSEGGPNRAGAVVEWRAK